jgi:outer membrane biosynthesis protein TonB
MAADSTADDSTAAESTVAGASAPAAGPTLLTRLRAVGYLLSGGMALSAVIHLALLGTVLVLTPRLLRPEPATAVTVDLVTPEELDKPEQKPGEKAEEKTKSPTPTQPQTPGITAQPQPSQQPTPPQQIASAVPPPSPPPPPPQPTLDAFAPPLAPSDAAAPPPPPPTSGPAAQMAQMLGLPEPVAGVTGGEPSEYKVNLTADEIAGFASHVQGCWTARPASATASKLSAYYRVRLRRDGSLAGPPVLVQAPGIASAREEAEMRALMSHAVNALQHCPAYRSLPADKYDQWQVLDLHFTPNGISTAAPAPSSERKPQHAG